MTTDKILSVRAIAEELNVSERQAEKCIKEGLIPVTKTFGKPITTQSILAEAVRASIQSQTK